jgi:hypothetical protein
MQTSPQYTTLPPEDGRTAQTRSSADLIYPAVTIIAMLLLLGSLWAF